MNKTFNIQIGKPSDFDDDDGPPESTIRGSEKGAVIGAWFGSIFFCGICWWFLHNMHIPHFYWFYPPLALLVFSKAIWETIRLNRFGDPVLELGTVPIPPGGRVEGRINITARLAKSPEFTATLACIHRVTTGTGKSSHTKETILWSDESKANLIGGILPISLSIPAEQPPTNDKNPFDCIVWRLTVKAPFPIIPFLEKYELPIYQATSKAK
jgi:hypothetical protein